MLPIWAAKAFALMRGPIGPILAACLLLALAGCAQSPAALPAPAESPGATQPPVSSPAAQAPVPPPSSDPTPSSAPPAPPSPPPSSSPSAPAPPSTTSTAPPTGGPKPPLPPITFVLKATTPAACADVDEIPALPQGNATLYTEYPVPAEAWNRSYQSSGANPVNGKVCAYWLDEGRKVLAMGDAGKVPAGASRLFAIIQGGSGEYKLSIA